MSGEEAGRPPDAMLLATKFMPPVARQGYLRRGRLHRRMAEASSTPITLLSAPAGFGKTTLLAGWLSELEEPWAWMSIDGHDNDPGRLWPHVIAALQRLGGPIGDGALLELRRGGGRGPVEGWLTPLVNDLAATSAPESYLVLDDLHLLTDAQERSGIGELALHLPGWLHLVISTRADPPLPLPRLRAEGRITEVREADLRFVAEEASLVLSASSSSTLDSGQIEMLVERTEGWAAGLQLATITLGDHAAGSRLETVVGSLRPFTDYLISEVVDQQPARMRDFLFATSIVDRVNPELANALSGEPDADALLRRAERQGLFLVALDGRDEWYRYHHLFAEALRHELRVRSPQAAADANSAAARWFEDHGDEATALEHWLAAGRPDDALRLAVDVAFALGDRGDAVTLEGIARRIPTSVPGDDPARQLDYAVLHLVFEPETFLAWVGQAAETLARIENPDHDLVTQYLMVQSFADLCVGAWDDAFEHASAAVGRGRTRGAVSYSQRAGLQVIRAAGWLERIDEAEAAFRGYVDDPRMPEALRVMIAPSAWAVAAALGGRIDDADLWSQHGAAASERGFYSTLSARETLLARAMVERERGDGEACVQTVEMLRTVDFEAYFSLRAVAEIELALVRVDQGRFDEAANTLDAALRVRGGGTLGGLVEGRVDGARSALCVACGDLVGARRAAERMPPGLWKEVALARSLIAAGAKVEAEDMLRALTPATPRQHVVVGVLRALSLAERSPDAARDHMVAALRTAAEVGLHQTVITAAAGVADLIETAGWAVPATWIERAHTAFAVAAGGPAVGRINRLVVQLTVRERDAVRYLPSRLTVPEIARELGVSANTLKTHLKGLYRKLEVTSREEAVIVARELGVLR